MTSVAPGTSASRLDHPGVAQQAAALDGYAQLLASLKQSFDVEFEIWDGQRGECVAGECGRSLDGASSGELCREIARRKAPEFIEEAGPILLLAIPLEWSDERTLVAVGAFVSRPARPDENLLEAAELIGLGIEKARQWISEQTPWPAERLLNMAQLFVSKARASRRADHLQSEVHDLSNHLCNSYEEISLLYRLTQKLNLSSTDEELSTLALEWLSEVLPAESLAIQLCPVGDEKSMTHRVRTEPLLLTHGQCPLDGQQFSQLASRLQLEAGSLPLVVNHGPDSGQAWEHPAIHQFIMVPLFEGKKLFGWMAAFNHARGEEFGTVEASLLSSVAVILGIHCGNTDLYREQSEFLEGVVRAFTSAIDAKDPSTCGHSDRVARTSVRLAQEMGCDANQIRLIYLSGLLHDVGKIGIDDHVLRKPDKLTAEEFEHVKKHTEIGYKILQDLKQLEKVLPVVLYHHEQWDGKGYPHRLAADEIPILARIVAVADGFDAMGSDRPYRKGMPDEKVDAILRAGAGQQWDARVVEAFFRARDDIRTIAKTERANLELDTRRWNGVPGYGSMVEPLR